MEGKRGRNRDTESGSKENKEFITRSWVVTKIRKLKVRFLSVRNYEQYLVGL